MSLVDMQLDEKFYNNHVCGMVLKVKISPYCTKGSNPYMEAQKLMENFRIQLLKLMQDVES